MAEKSVKIPPRMTEDDESGVLYVKLRRGKIKQTFDATRFLNDRNDISINLDVDSRNDIIGIEILL